MGKKKKTFYLVLRGRKPGVYQSFKEAMNQVLGLEDLGAKMIAERFPKRASAQSAFRYWVNQGQVAILEDPPASELHVFVDGSFSVQKLKGGASALLHRESKKTPLARAALQIRSASAREAEELALLLGLLLLRPGEKAVVHTDLEALPLMWHGQLPASPRVQAARALAEALGLEVRLQLIKSRRNPVHKEANGAAKGLLAVDLS